MNTAQPIENDKASYRKTSESVGVYTRESSRRKFRGKPDFCFDISYQIGNKLIWEKVGWKSEGFSLRDAENIRARRMKAIRQIILEGGNGNSPQAGRSEIIRQSIPAKDPEPVPFFRDIAKQYLEWCKENKAKEGGDDISRHRKHLAHRFDALRMNEINPLDLEKMKSELTKEGKSAGTVAHCLKLMRQIFNKAKLWNLYDGENPAKGVKFPKLDNQRMRFLSHEEAERLLGELGKASEHIRDIALVSLHTGMRAGEVFNLRAQDIDLVNGIITIVTAKNGESRRTYMTGAVRDILRKRIDGEAAAGGRWGNRKKGEEKKKPIPLKPTDHIFRSTKGKMVGEVSETFKRVVKRIGLNDGIEDSRYKITFHSLRHTFASWLAMQGEPILTIKELLGHKTIDMTLRYSHLAPDQKRRAILNLEDAHRKAASEEALPGRSA